MKYLNPILSGFNPDPSICKVDNYFYLVTSTFEYFPGVPIYRSLDMIQWELIGHCLTRKSQLDLTGIKSSQGIFAPTIRYINKNFYMITTCVGGCGHFYVTAKDPTKEWSDPIYVEGDGFDPDLFQDEDGKVYLTRQNMSGGIIQFEIDVETGQLISEGNVIWKGFEDEHCEGPHIYKIDRWYYLLVAEGGTHIGHMSVVARSQRVSGPFVNYEKNPVLTHRGKTDTEIKGTGHGDLIRDKWGHWWMVFLGIRQVGDWNSGFWHHLGRETFLAPVEFDEAGWPVVNENKRITINMEVKDRESSSAMENIVEYLTYYRRGTSDNKAVEITNSGSVRINFRKETLNDTLPPNFVGMKQRHFECVFDVTLKSNVLRSQEAGITVLMNELYHYDIGCIREDNNIVLIFRRTIGDMSFIQNKVVLCNDIINSFSIGLFIRAQKFYYEFGYRIGNQENTLGTGSTKFLSSEVAAGFTGVFFGLYATGNGKSYKEMACFNQISYKNIR